MDSWSSVRQEKRRVYLSSPVFEAGGVTDARRDLWILDEFGFSSSDRWIGKSSTGEHSGMLGTCVEGRLRS